MNLLGLLQQRSGDAPLWLTPAGSHSAAQALRSAAALRRTWESAGGRAVAVWAHDALLFGHAVLALDGFASRLLLLPAALPANDVQAACREAGVDFIVADVPTAASDGMPQRLPADLPPVDAGDAGQIADHGALATEWVLATSGTTGLPKLVSHTLATLTATVQRDERQGTQLVWGLLYDPARFAGLQVFLQALAGGSALCLPDRGEAMPAQVQAMAAAGVNALSATPTLWRRLLMSTAVGSLPLGRVTMGGEIADAPLLRRVTLAFPGARVRHIYASTEAGVGFSVADGLEGFPAAWLATPPAGIELAIAADELAPDEGELLIRSSRLASRYLGQVLPKDDLGWLRSGDRVRRLDGRVTFMGRLGGCINIGGDKVFPESVERVLLAWPGVLAATVRGRRSAFTGALVEATVVLTPGAGSGNQIRSMLLAHCRAVLPRAAVPGVLRFAADLGLSDAGKQLRVAA